MVEETLNDPLSSGGGPRDAAVEPQLIVALECARPQAGPLRVSLADADEVLIGRGEARRVAHSVENRRRRITLTLPDARMSSKHGLLVSKGDEWVYEDAGSRNGSMINGRAVDKGLVAEGDVLQVGRTLIVVRTDAEVPSVGVDLDYASLASIPVGFRTLDAMQARDLDRLMRIARDGGAVLPVLLLGDTGTGKEVLARAVHALSPRRGDFVAVNCGALPETLVESQLFGHVRGAFSGAVRDHLGFVRAAEGGTLFLDEIGDLPPLSQAALLRVLQEREVVPVGATKPVSVDLRVIAATHADLETRVREGRFRADLLARLAGFTFHLPALRDRREDVGLLLADLIAKRGESLTFAPDVGRALLRYDWPHNVRELEQCLSSASVLAGQGPIEIAHLPPKIAEAASRAASPPPRSEDTVDDPMRAQLIAALDAHGGNVSEVARALGKARPLVHRWLKRYRIDPKLYRARGE